VSEDVLELIGEWCTLLSMGKQFEEARRRASLAMEMASDQHGVSSVEYARSLRLRGDVERLASDWLAAERWYLRALETGEKTLGLDHPAVADVLDGLTWCYRSRGRHDEAEKLYLRALETREKTLGLDHPDVADVLVGLAGCYRDQGKYDE